MKVSDGKLSGSSERGGRMEGEVADGPRGNGSYLIPGTVTAPDGRESDFEAAASTRELIEGRFIVLADGRIKGAKKGGGAGFIDLNSDH